MGKVISCSSHNDLKEKWCQRAHHLVVCRGQVEGVELPVDVDGERPELVDGGQDGLDQTQ